MNLRDPDGKAPGGVVVITGPGGLPVPAPVPPPPTVTSSGGTSGQITPYNAPGFLIIEGGKIILKSVKTELAIKTAPLLLLRSKTKTVTDANKAKEVQAKQSSKNKKDDEEDEGRDKRKSDKEREADRLKKEQELQKKSNFAKLVDKVTELMGHLLGN